MQGLQEDIENENPSKSSDKKCSKSNEGASISCNTSHEPSTDTPRHGHLGSHVSSATQSYASAATPANLRVPASYGCANTPQHAVWRAVMAAIGLLLNSLQTCAAGATLHASYVIAGTQQSVWASRGTTSCMHTHKSSMTAVKWAGEALSPLCYDLHMQYAPNEPIGFLVRHLSCGMSARPLSQDRAVSGFSSPATPASSQRAVKQQISTTAASGADVVHPCPGEEKPSPEQGQLLAVETPLNLPPTDAVLERSVLAGCANDAEVRRTSPLPGLDNNSGPSPSTKQKDAEVVAVDEAMHQGCQATSAAPSVVTSGLSPAMAVSCSGKAANIADPGTAVYELPEAKLSPCPASAGLLPGLMLADLGLTRSLPHMPAVSPVPTTPMAGARSTPPHGTVCVPAGALCGLASSEISCRLPQRPSARGLGLMSHPCNFSGQGDSGQPITPEPALSAAALASSAMQLEFLSGQSAHDKPDMTKGVMSCNAVIQPSHIPPLMAMDTGLKASLKPIATSATCAIPSTVTACAAPSLMPGSAISSIAQEQVTAAAPMPSTLKHTDGIVPKLLQCSPGEGEEVAGQPEGRHVRWQHTPTHGRVRPTIPFGADEEEKGAMSSPGCSPGTDTKSCALQCRQLVSRHQVKVSAPPQ